MEVAQIQLEKKIQETNEQNQCSDLPVADGLFSKSHCATLDDIEVPQNVTFDDFEVAQDFDSKICSTNDTMVYIEWSFDMDHISEEFWNDILEK